MKNIWLLSFVVLLALKLTGCIDWSWWVITAPLWGMFAIVFALIALGLVLVIMVGIVVEEG